MSENLPNFFTSQEEEVITDDIPEALRDTPVPVAEVQETASSGSGRGMWIGFAGVAIALSTGIFIFSSNFLTPNTASESRVPLSSATETNELGEDGAEEAETPTTSDRGNLLGHLAYEEAPVDDLMAITADGSLRLRKMAAIKFQQMVNAAQRDGVVLVPLSAFRSLNDQEYLFFDVKAQRGQVATQRAEVSAPPGYSEHHTGYAIDIGDGYVPAVDFSPEFENTSAFKWLEENAAYYSFELSFPPNNPQGISYEPWHWRFVGDRHSLETFYKAREEFQTDEASEE
ncbi:D-alanyl-D-alanine carboxypeptidase family protein [Roseofilum reptotaenium CS-1145]|uniref:D-alanyl-D-alanine carboxypeptidase n=1 Tax=Roseofilum reptotaenium AO1-A TaxID=1925591 RepID=A0A1L9QUL7_9CYAN|nr:M15 family metallopeptidase [Roseofilum reptotaenium]MDB9517662.1 D-alanyl-D-alanine carboxypeptidase family protein [Roseofilum reptotaenium CS-1145]OJJ26380.1 D-alanyl-D-alanine carboxypeptidase [Roseofilum reptotaenium AO1-A]